MATASIRFGLAIEQSADAASKTRRSAEGQSTAIRTDSDSCPMLLAWVTKPAPSGNVWVAQSVEQWIENPRVDSSILSPDTEWLGTRPERPTLSPALTSRCRCLIGACFQSVDYRLLRQPVTSYRCLHRMSQERANVERRSPSAVTVAATLAYEPCTKTDVPIRWHAC